MRTIKRNCVQASTVSLAKTSCSYQLFELFLIASLWIGLLSQSESMALVNPWDSLVPSTVGNSSCFLHHPLSLRCRLLALLPEALPLFPFFSPPSVVITVLTAGSF